MATINYRQSEKKQEEYNRVTKQLLNLKEKTVLSNFDLCRGKACEAHFYSFILFALWSHHEKNPPPAAILIGGL
jgi:hypothetical protein